MDLKDFFKLVRRRDIKIWTFVPNEYVNSTRYSVSFSDAPTESDAWKVLNLAVQKSPDFFFKKINFINIPKDFTINDHKEKEKTNS